MSKYILFAFLLTGEWLNFDKYLKFNTKNILHVLKYNRDVYSAI